MKKLLNKKTIIIVLILFSVIVSLVSMLIFCFSEVPSSDPYSETIFWDSFELLLANLIMTTFLFSIGTLVYSGYRCLFPCTIFAKSLYIASIVLSLFIIWSYGLGAMKVIPALFIIAFGSSFLVVPINIIIASIATKINNKHIGKVN